MTEICKYIYFLCKNYAARDETVRSVAPHCKIRKCSIPSQFENQIETEPRCYGRGTVVHCTHTSRGEKNLLLNCVCCLFISHKKLHVRSHETVDLDHHPFEHTTVPSDLSLCNLISHTSYKSRVTILRWDRNTQTAHPTPLLVFFQENAVRPEQRTWTTQRAHVCNPSCWPFPLFTALVCTLHIVRAFLECILTCLYATCCVVMMVHDRSCG